jgi:hypothetical protein
LVSRPTAVRIVIACAALHAAAQVDGAPAMIVAGAVTIIADGKPHEVVITTPR